MNKTSLTIVLALALIIAFFLPYYSHGASALDAVKGPGDWKKYLLLVFPICGALLLVGELSKNYVASRSLLTWLPFLTILLILLIFPLVDGVKFNYILKSLGKGYGAGLWTLIISSVILAFYNPR